MFVHPVKYTYDPDAPPEQPGLLDDEDDDDEDEPPTAIHMSPYRGDATPGMPEAMGQPPRLQPTPPPAPLPAPVPAAGERAHPPVQPGFAPPGVAEPAPPARPKPDPRMFETQQLPSAQYAPPPVSGQTGQTGPGVATPAGDPMATFVDPDAAPVWLKAVALSSVVSALTVLGVLGWMLSVRL